MNTFTISELYELSDGLTERRKRLLTMRDSLGRGATDMLNRMIDASGSAHTKVMDEIGKRSSELIKE